MVLLLAAILEAVGTPSCAPGCINMRFFPRVALMLMAGAVLFAYGWTVNAPPWDLGKLLGIYMIFFFLVAEFISWAFFKQPPSASLVLGGALIVAGGVVIAAKA